MGDGGEVGRRVLVTDESFRKGKGRGGQVKSAIQRERERKHSLSRFFFWGEIVSESLTLSLSHCSIAHRKIRLPIFQPVSRPAGRPPHAGAHQCAVSQFQFQEVRSAAAAVAVSDQCKLCATC